MLNAKTVKVREVSEAQPGFAFRTAVKHDPMGNYYVLQMRDFNDGDGFDYTQLTKTFQPDMKDRFLAQPGDVIARTRGTRLTCAKFDNSNISPIVSYPLFKLTEIRGDVAPEYLVWAINHPESQARLAANTQGATIPMISKADLENLEFPLPDYETQMKIVSLDKLARREAELMDRLKECRRQYVNEILMHGASGSLLKGGQ